MLKTSVGSNSFPSLLNGQNDDCDSVKVEFLLGLKLYLESMKKVTFHQEWYQSELKTFGKLSTLLLKVLTAISDSTNSINGTSY